MQPLADACAYAGAMAKPPLTRGDTGTPAAGPAAPQWTPAGTLLLRIDPAAWPPPRQGLRLDGVDFAPKTELHATIVGRALGARLQAAMAADTALAARVEALRTACDWSWTRAGAWWLLRKSDAGTTKASIVERIALPAMARFHARLGELLGHVLPVPPPHVTLYTAGDAEGIGVPDAAAWSRHAVRQVAAGELQC